MSETGPRLRTLRLLARREERFLSIIERALQMLRDEKNLPEAECDLNRRFYFQLLNASRELFPADPVAPVSECNNQPDPDDQTRAAREQKRPDFQWLYLDKYEPDPKRSSRQFTLECKRLGAPHRADWVLNVNYVTNGICRFRDPAWAYGQRFSRGAMVGYWQSMELEEILNEVNDEASRNALPEIAPAGATIPNGYRAEHIFDRAFSASPFCLHHIWIDLRVTGRS